jgi:hypothetical protein
MIAYTFPGASLEIKENTALRQLANSIIKSILPAAVCRKSFIINDIPANIFLNRGEDLTAIVLNNLLINTLSSSMNSCIRVSAIQEYGETVIIVNDNNSDYSRYISGKMAKVLPIVNKMGGDLRFELNKDNNITIRLSFMDESKAA